MNKKILDKNSETYKNLQTALQGEALAFLKYQFYQKKLSEYSKEYSNLLDEVIHNEKEHAEIWFKQLHNNTIPDNVENLIDAINGETLEHLELYPMFAETAYLEGYDDIGFLFENIAIIEGNHSKQFQNIKNNIENENSFKSDTEIYWKCLNCGHILKSKDAPVECPVCKHPSKYFIKL